MLFKDRVNAAKLLLEVLKKDLRVSLSSSQLAVVSLLRGGVVIGRFLSKKLQCIHLPLTVAKIPSPTSEELAIGAVCFDIVHLEKGVVESLGLSKRLITPQIQKAQEKFDSYSSRFHLRAASFNKIGEKTVLLVDDGIATGATARAALLFLKSRRPRKVFLATPVVPTDFNAEGFDGLIAVHRELFFSAVSQFYEDFPQVSDKEVKKLIQ